MLRDMSQKIAYAEAVTLMRCSSLILKVLDEHVLTAGLNSCLCLFTSSFGSRARPRDLAAESCARLRAAVSTRLSLPRRRWRVRSHEIR